MEGLKRARPAEFADLPQGVLAHLVHFLPPVQQLYTFPQICKATAAACEAACKERCREWSISLPRRPRGPAATYSLYPHIYAVRQRACRKCGRRGEFHMRTTSGRVRRVSFASVMQEPGLLCKRCCRDPGLKRELVRRDIRIDIQGVTGKRLFPAKWKPRA